MCAGICSSNLLCHVWDTGLRLNQIYVCLFQRKKPPKLHTTQLSVIWIWKKLESKLQYISCCHLSFFSPFFSSLSSFFLTQPQNIVPNEAEIPATWSSKEKKSSSCSSSPLMIFLCWLRPLASPVRRFETYFSSLIWLASESLCVISTLPGLTANITAWLVCNCLI